MNKLSILAAPLLASSFAAIAAPDASLTDIQFPLNTPGVAMITFKSEGICGDYVGFSKTSRAHEGELLMTFKVNGKSCKAGEQAKTRHFISEINVPQEAALVGIKTQNPVLRIEIKPEVK